MRRLTFALLATGLTNAAAGQNADWTPAAGLATGRVSVLRTNDVKPSVLWVGGSGGAYVSKDDGRSWTLKTASLPDRFRLGVPNRVMDVDRRNPDIVYAAIGEILYRTSDGGATWSPFPREAPDVLLELDPVHPGDFYLEARGYEGVVCWGSTSSPLLYSCRYPFGGVFAIDPTNTDTLYARNLKSTDGGKTWAYLSAPIEMTFARVDDAGALWIGGYDFYSLGARVLKSKDGGATWTDLSGGLPTQRPIQFPLTVGEIAASPTNPSVLVAAVGPIWYESSESQHPDSGFYRSIDGGAHWYRLGSHFEATTVAFAGANSETLVGGTASSGVVTTDANPPAAPISIESVTPGTGSTNGGTLVLISGSGFTPYSFVEIGGRPTTDFTFFNASTIRIRTTAHAAGLGEVVVHNADGGVAAKAGAFQFEDWAAPANYPLSRCDPTQGLCLENGRFWVTVSRPGAGIVPTTHPVPLSQKSGYFWFDFSPSVEVVVKVLDGRTIDGHYWIHWSALTEQAFSLTVMDRLTMTPRVYEKPAGSVTAVIDRTSF